MNPNLYCEEVLKKSGSNFSSVFRFLSPDKRQALTAVYAFCKSVDDIADTVSEVSIAEKKLTWWQHEIDRLFRGMPEHPITKALLGPIKQFDLKQVWFMSLIEGMLWDVHQVPIQTLEDLEAYTYRVASVVGFMSAKIFGARTDNTLEFATYLGRAFQWVNMIRDIGEDVREGRIYFPRALYESHGVTETMLRLGQNTPQIRSFLATEAKRARQYYAKALSFLSSAERKAQRPSLVMAAIYFDLLDTLEDSQFDVMDRKINLTSSRKFITAWKVIIKEMIPFSGQRSSSSVAVGQD
ncbi:MAG: squalene synthase HpnD [Legionellales bacterium]|nr:squalene synthase HpnD [Legionellales bacterium]|tara:strand:- start:558 stop:1445 length:888 start_codon:yes stop_codon:yes gene_type:complete